MLKLLLGQMLNRYKPKTIMLELMRKNKKRKLQVLEIGVKEVNKINNKKSFKIILTVKDPYTGYKFDISDAYIKVNNESKISGLWCSKTYNINQEEILVPGNTVNKICNHYNINDISELINKNIIVAPDKNNYLTIMGY